MLLKMNDLFSLAPITRYAQPKYLYLLLERLLSAIYKQCQAKDKN